LAQEPVALGAQIIHLLPMNAQQFLQASNLGLKLRGLDFKLVRFSRFSQGFRSSHIPVPVTVPRNRWEDAVEFRRVDGVAAVIMPGRGNPARLDGSVDRCLADTSRLSCRSEGVAHETRSRLRGTVS
jgi:hypothetical protein